MRRVPGFVALILILLIASTSAVAAARPDSAFAGTWVGIDLGDGSTVTAVITGDTTTQVIYADENATSACAGASTSAFTSRLVGKVHDGAMTTTMTRAKCGTQPRPHLHGLEMEWYLLQGDIANPADDVLLNTFGEEFTRAD